MCGEPRKLHGMCETDSTQFVARSKTFLLATQKDWRLRLEKHAKETWQGIIVLLFRGRRRSRPFGSERAASPRMAA